MYVYIFYIRTVIIVIYFYACLIDLSTSGELSAEPSNVTLLMEMKKMNEAISKVHKRLKNTEDAINEMQSELNLLAEKKQSKSAKPSREIRVSTHDHD